MEIVDRLQSAFQVNSGMVIVSTIALLLLFLWIYLLKRKRQKCYVSTSRPLIYINDLERDNTPLHNALETGFEAIKMAQWIIAQDSFVKAIELVPDHAEAHVSLAIAYYELGNLDKAEEHYEFAKKTNPQMASCFTEHISFRV